MGRPLACLHSGLTVPDQVHQIGGVLAVVDGEAGIETDLSGIVAQEPRADTVKGAGPAERAGHDAGIRCQAPGRISAPPAASSRPRRGAIGVHPPREPRPQLGELVIGYWLGKNCSTNGGLYL